MAKSREYWTDRFETLQDAQLKQADKVAKDLDKAYKKALASVERDILTWYQRFADNNQIDLTDAYKLLIGGELREFKWTVEDYIQFGKANQFDQRYMKELENASARVHIRRLEALQLQIRHQVETIHAKRYQDLEKLSTDIYTERYYRTAYETQLGFNVGWNIDHLDLDAVGRMIRKPWAPDGLDFSSRIWRDRSKMVNTLYNELTQSIITGQGPRDVISKMASAFNVSKNTAGRLVMTESAFFASAAQRDALKDLDVERYQYVATLDLKTSDICQEMDREIFPINQYQVGVTAPPLHSWCRSTTIPYFEDNYGERAARDADGKTYYVPNDMTYTEWYNEYVGRSELPKVLKTGKTSKLNQSLRFKNESGSYDFIPLNTVITNVSVIAGKGVSTTINDLERLKAAYGGVEWTKRAGKIESKSRIFDIHWYQNENAIYEQKLKTVKRR